MIKLDGVIIAMSHPPYDSCSLSSLRPELKITINGYMVIMVITITITGAASAEGTSQLGFIQFDENVFLD